MVEVLIGVVFGAVLGALTTIRVETWRERRLARSAARLIETELIEITITAAGVIDAPYPFPLKRESWIAFRDRLVGRLSDGDLSSLASFYMQNELVEGNVIKAPLGSDVQRQAATVAAILSRYRRRRRLRPFVGRQKR